MFVTEAILFIYSFLYLFMYSSTEYENFKILKLFPIFMVQNPGEK